MAQAQTAQPARSADIDIKKLVSDVIRLAGVKMRDTDPLVELVILNEKILETMVPQIAEKAALAAAQSARREVVLLLQQHDATFGERANELSEMIEENILAASREGAAIVSGAVEGSAQATGERILAQIEKFSGVVRRVEYLAYAMVIGVVILSIGILLGRFL